MSRKGLSMWTWINHPGGFGRRWRYHDTNLLRLPCWFFKAARRSTAQPCHASGTLRWTAKAGKEERGTITWRLEPAVDGWVVTLDYVANGRPVLMGLAMTADTVAGSARQRWWWRCPDCDRRCGVLFLIPASLRFTCRLCGSVTYSSRQREHPARLNANLISAYNRMIGSGGR